MPSFISKNGMHHAAKEKAVNIRTGEVYEGPDREAVRFIASELGVSEQMVIEKDLAIGMNAIDDPQIQEVARQRGMTVEQWMERNKPSQAQVKAQEEAQKKVVTHMPEAPKPQASNSLGGFYDQDQKQDPVSEFNKKMKS